MGPQIKEQTLLFLVSNSGPFLQLHRRILHDDAFGVNEALNEQAYGRGLVATGTHLVTGGPVASQSAADRRLVQQRVLDAWTFITPTTLSLANWQSAYNMEVSQTHSSLNTFKSNIPCSFL